MNAGQSLSADVRKVLNPSKLYLVLPVLLLLALFPLLHGGDGALLVLRREGIQPPVETMVTWTGQPGLHHTITLNAQVTPKVQADDLTLRWVLPAGVTLSGQPTESLGAVAAGQTVTRQRDVTFDQTGIFQIAVDAQMEIHDPSIIYGDADVLFVTIREGLGSRISRRGPGIPSPRERIDTPNVRYSVTAEPAVPEQAYWVTGRFMYEDIPIDSAGVDPPVLVPARQVRVEVWEDDPIFDDYEGSVRTDDEGYFSFRVSNNDDGWFGGDKETYLEIYANTPGGYVTDRTFIDDDYYCYTDNERGGSDIDFGTMSPTNFHRMFNISDVLLDARRYVRQFRGSVERIKVQYEPGYGESVSFYDDFWVEITLADAGGDDGYDDTVIIHEYGHAMADQYACDDSPGGPHGIRDHINNDLAWSEGWASYLSSAVRGSSWYLDWDFTSSSWSVHADWEPWTVTGSDNEGAVTATLWDLHDPSNETYDRMSLGGNEIWQVVDDRMEEEWWNDPWTDCDIFVFWDEWLAAGHPDDSELAAIFAEHRTAGLSPSMAAQADGQVRPISATPLTARAIQVGPAYGPDGRAEGPDAPTTIVRGGVPWNAVLFLVDATNSMAGEIAAVRQIIQDKVNDMDAEPDPYEYIIETFQDDGTNLPVVDHFFPDVVNPPVGAITVGGGGDAAEDSFAALARGTADRFGFDAWLLTDAAPKYEVSVGELEGLLQRREITPYFFIFGDCSGGNAASSEAAGEVITPQPAPPGQLHLPRFAPAGLEECVEPYLLVAGGTNGQFLLIDTSQIDDAAEIVRAFMSNNAGAGRYADYVSTSWSYSWDDTGYDWYDASGGDDWNIYDHQAVALPQAFSFYNTSHNTIYVAAPGYVSFSNFAAVSDNTGIPTPALPNNTIYAFWDDISAYVLPRSGADAQASVIYTDYDVANNRFVIEYQDAYHLPYDPTQLETFEILLDYDTGEIILQYSHVTDDSSCTVGVENASGTVATQVIYNNPGSLYAGRAIKFTPLPPQPTNDHEVIVDSTMDGVIFLLNGYSGEVALTVYRPDGTPVDPDDPDVTFLDVGRIKYYRVSGPEAGTWIARASGNGTYYFTSSATSPLEADHEGDSTLTSAIANPIVVNLGMSLTVQPDFSLVNPDGSFFDDLDLYDDGAHGDDEADDGIYGGAYNAPANGTFYLQVDGQTPGGDDFRRTDLTPIRFQGMELVPPVPAEQFVMFGDTVVYSFTLYNDTSVWLLFVFDLQSSQGWASLPVGGIIMPPYSWAYVPVTVDVPWNAGNVVEETILTVRSGGMADTAATATTVRGPVTTMAMMAQPLEIAPNGDQATVWALVRDDLDWNVADGTEVAFSTSLGAVDPPVAIVAGGMATTTLTSGAATGIAQVQAMADGVSALIEVEITAASACTLTLTAEPGQLPSDGISTALLTAHVYDQYGDPAPNGSQVVFGVEGDEMLRGSIDGQEVYTGTTSGGIATATYRSGTIAGPAMVRAELPVSRSSGGGEGVGRRPWTTTTIWLGGRVYLPLVVKGAP